MLKSRELFTVHCSLFTDFVDFFLGVFDNFETGLLIERCALDTS